MKSKTEANPKLSTPSSNCTDQSAGVILGVNNIPVTNLQPFSSTSVNNNNKIIITII